MKLTDELFKKYVEEELKNIYYKDIEKRKIIIDSFLNFLETKTNYYIIEIDNIDYLLEILSRLLQKGGE